MLGRGGSETACADGWKPVLATAAEVEHSAEAAATRKSLIVVGAGPEGEQPLVNVRDSVFWFRTEATRQYF